MVVVINSDFFQLSVPMCELAWAIRSHLLLITNKIFINWLRTRKVSSFGFRFLRTSNHFNFSPFWILSVISHLPFDCIVMFLICCHFICVRCSVVLSLGSCDFDVSCISPLFWKCFIIIVLKKGLRVFWFAIAQTILQTSQPLLCTNRPSPIAHSTSHIALIFVRYVCLNMMSGCDCICQTITLHVRCSIRLTS